VTLLIRISSQSPPVKLLARLKHDIERNPRPDRNFATDPIPQPFRAEPSQTIPVKNHPALIDLLCELNLLYTRERAEQWLGPGLCYTNQTWGVFHAPVITGGAVLEVLKIEESRVYFKSILISDPVPTVQQVLDNHLSHIGTSVHMDGRPGIMTRPDGRYKGSRSPFRMFIVREISEDLSFPVNDVQLLPPGVDPSDNPLWMP